MGAGDNIMASGMARGAHARGKRVAFGVSGKIMWDVSSAPVFRYNPNVAPPGSQDASDLEWVKYCKGHRIYNRIGGKGWEWNFNFRAQPGELFFDKNELLSGERAGEGFVLIEPNVPRHKSVAPNKSWPFERYAAVASELIREGVDVVQFDYQAPVLPGVRRVKTDGIRDAFAILRRARLYIGPEGGLHHAAAALGIPAVVLFGGFIPPQVTGYDSHVNLTGGAEACGSIRPCDHCKAAMQAIGVDEVLAGARRLLIHASNDLGVAAT